MIKKSTLFILIIIMGGISGIVADRYIFPYLAATKPFQKYNLLKKSSEDVTVINKTEQIYVKEDSSISKITNQAASSVVTIFSYPDPDAKSLSVKTTKQVVPVTGESGAGVIVTSDGMIMTYATAIVVENSKFKVLTFDGNSYDAELLGIDSWSNLAFLKIYASNLPVVSFGNSDEMKPGEKIVAIGISDSKYHNLFSAGILSDFDPTYNLAGKTLSSSEKLEGVFRSDISWGKKYVGGPIVDYAGQAVGITGSTEMDGAIKYFQIPANKVKLVLDRAISKELDKNYTLGIYYFPITKNYAVANNLKTEKGAFIYSPSGQQGLAIIAGSPAAKADLRINDIITQVNGEEINLDVSLSDLLYKHKKGEEIELTILRDGNEMKVKVQI
jgi:serine protease Do